MITHRCRKDSAGKVIDQTVSFPKGTQLTFGRDMEHIIVQELGAPLYRISIDTGEAIPIDNDKPIPLVKKAR